MYPTFSGSSRRPRNVNLSGQVNNPFAAGSWGPSTGTGSAQSIANAQAERRQRQEERDRLKAGKDIQRTWRGHRSRRALLQDRRRDFDHLYSISPGTASHVEERLKQGLPLILFLFDPSNDGDYQRLEYVAKDMANTNYTYLTAIRRPRIFLDLLLRTLDRTSSTSLCSNLFDLLVHLFNSLQDAAQDALGSYFRLLAKYAQVTTHNSEQLKKLVSAIVAPLQTRSRAAGKDESGSRVYQEFVLSFLTRTLPALELDPDLLRGHLSFELLSSSIIVAFSSKATEGKTQDELLWLLSHFIALTAANVSAEALHLRALLIQISDLATVIRARLQDKDVPSSQTASSDLPPYVKTQILSLVSSTAISRLLDGFTFGSESVQEMENATMLAGYTLALMRCFPGQGDEIRMRLYLADISSDGSKLPSLNVFWMAMKATSAFQRIRDSSAESALQFLAQRKYFQPPASSSNDSHWDREWRAILLFLELYTFVLKLTDDDDFFAKLGTETTVQGQQQVSRLRTCSLSLHDLTGLTLFLKNLAFTLHYHSPELLRSTERPSSHEAGRRQSLSDKDVAFEVISGVSYFTFKETVTTAASMLYERDSRRPFLPKDHWLMTANFEMSGFMSAVIMEEERQHELQDEDESEKDSDGDEDEQASSMVYIGTNVQRLSRQAAIERMRAESAKATKARVRATLMPKLGLLRRMPYVIPFELRIAIFRQFIAQDQKRRRDGFTDPDMWRMHMRQRSSDWAGASGNISRHHAEIKRGQIFEDAFTQFYGLADGFKEPIQITFVDQFDTIEAGIDGGGVTKEFLLSTTQEAFDPERGFFIANSHSLFFPNPYALDQKEVALQAAGLKPTDLEYQTNITELLSRYEFLGRVVGKCLYEGILMNVAFAGFFLLKWSMGSDESAGYRASINDLRELDEELYQGLMRLKDYNGDVSDLALDFTINDQVSAPGEPILTKTRDLVPNGLNLSVTNENRPLYISYTARHRLAAQPYRQTRAFLRGLESIIRPSWLSMFNQQELQRLVGGDSTEIDIEDLRKHTHYGGLYDPGTDPEDHPTIQMFWEMMQEIQDVDRRAVLQYVTSTPRAPLLGFSQLNPRFSIRDAGTDEARLPSASTCVNLLKLPRYTRYETLKSKLLYAVRSNAGFDLS